MKLYSKNTNGPCANLNVSYLTECKFVATFCVSDRSMPCWFVERTWVSVKTWIIKHRLRFLKKIDVSSSIGPNKSLKTGKFSSAQAGVKWRFVMSQISLDYFFHHQGFVFTRADNNLFVAQPILREINSSLHHVFVLLCGTLTTVKFIWEMETHVGENFFNSTTSRF